MYCSRLTRKAFTLAVWVAFRISELTLRRKHVGLRLFINVSLPVLRLLPSTGRYMWLVQLITSLTSNLYTVIIRKCIRENNGINSHAQNTTLFSPKYFFKPELDYCLWTFNDLTSSCAITVKVTFFLVSCQQLSCTKCWEQSEAAQSCLTLVSPFQNMRTGFVSV
jgi:hypothetical protein